MGRPQTKKVMIAIVSAIKPILRSRWLINATTAETIDNAVPNTQAPPVTRYTDALGPVVYRNIVVPQTTAISTMEIVNEIHANRRIFLDSGIAVMGIDFFLLGEDICQ